MGASRFGGTLNYFRIFLAILTLLYAGIFVRDTVEELSTSNGFLLADGTSPVGGDFINAYSAGALAASGRTSAVYDPLAFMAFERTIVRANLGLRLWAYPPTSLVLVLPFGLVRFEVALVAWTLLGLGVLVLGARRMGLSGLDTALLALSPAALSNVYFGQTGNLSTGLLLIALAVKKPTDMRSAVAAAILTIKPQLGFLLPVLWLVQRRFALIGVTVLMLAAFVAITLFAFGPQTWLDYAYKTLPVLNELERNGNGPFTVMIPSVFMAVRIVSDDAQLAQMLHLAVALMVIAWVVWRFVTIDDAVQRSAILLIATALITPYIHIYDLAMVLAGALLHLRRVSNGATSTQLVAGVAALFAWGLPTITVFGNVYQLPMGPLVLLALLVIVSWPSRAEAPGAAMVGAPPSPH